MPRHRRDPPAPAHRFTMAVDVGQAHDYTAAVILHSYDPSPTATNAKGKPRARLHDLVSARRIRDDPYPEQIRQIQKWHASLKRHARTFEDPFEDITTSVSLVVDATGVGKPILDAFREADLQPYGIIITGGETASHGDGVTRVPKRELATTLQVALQAKRLRIAEGLPLADTLLQELRGFKVKISLSGHASFGNDVGSWREAAHDDLVLATALGVWHLEKQEMAIPRIPSRVYQNSW